MRWNKTLPQDKIHGILRGFTLTWESATFGFVQHGVVEVGPETTWHNLTGLRDCTSYWIGISGRTAVGIGAESRVLVETEIGGKNKDSQTTSL